jgi:hypothetical protein
MTTQRLHRSLRLATLAALALCASDAVLADDSSMSPLTGDSYAYFYGLDYHAGGFNTPRAVVRLTAPRAEPMAGDARGAAADPAPAARPQPFGGRILLATPGNAGRIASPFRDDTGA